MKTRLITFLIASVLSASTFGGVVSFDPPLTTASPGDTLQFDVWLSSSDGLDAFRGVQMVLGSDSLDLQAFEYDAGFVAETDFQNTPRPLGFYESDLFIGAFADEPAPLPTLVGTLTVLVPASLPDEGTAVIEGIGLLGIPGGLEFLVGTATIQIGDVGDCNDNGLPDAEDIALGNSADCNFNDVPDECDIVGGVSDDVDPADGVPDECAVFSGFCAEPGMEDHWTCFDNWNLLGPVYPDDDDSAAGIHVTLVPPNDVFLDETVTIPSLVVNPGARLRVTQSGDEGNLLFSAPAQFALKGIVHVDGDRVLGEASDVAGTKTPSLTVGPGGVYRRDPFATAAIVTAELFVAELIIEGSAIFENGGRVELSDEMSLRVDGLLWLNGGQGLARIGLRGETPNRGITPPPKFGATNESSAQVGGTVLMVGEVETDNDSEVGMLLAGDFFNQGQYPSLFEWSEGRLEMDGTEPQFFEVAGLDLGPVFEGFLTDEDTLAETAPHSNFSIGTLQIGNDDHASHVTFVNEFPNTVGTGACVEALYVETLVLKPGSTITLDNVRIYYRMLIEESGAESIETGCGELRQICSVNAPGAEQPGVIPKNRYLSFSPSNAGLQTATQVTFTSLPGFEYAEGRAMWVQEPVAVSEAAGSTGGSPSPTFWAAELGCTPYYTDWSVYGTVDVYNAAIIPGTAFDIRTVDQACDATVSSNLSDLLPAATSMVGDLVGNCTATPCTLPEGIVDFVDIASVVDKFRNDVTAPRKARADLVGADLQDPIPDQKIDFTDISFCVDAFRNNVPPPPGPPVIDPCS